MTYPQKTLRNLALLKLHEKCNQFLTSMKTKNEEIKRMFQQTQNLLQNNYELQLLIILQQGNHTATRKIELAKQREKNKILCIDLDSIKNQIVQNLLEMIN